MNNFVPYNKRSKKEQKQQNQRKRGSWNGVNPVTKKTKNPRAYQRNNKILEGEDDLC